MERNIDIKLEPKIIELRSVLEKKYPKCFFPVGAEPKPLKIGITKEVIKELKESPHSDLATPETVKNFMLTYSSSSEYKQSLQVKGAMRIDLSGNEVGPISAKHIEHAKKGAVKVKFVAKTPQKKKPDNREQQKTENIKRAKSKNIVQKKETPNKTAALNPAKIKLGNTQIKIKPKRKTLTFKGKIA